MQLCRINMLFPWAANKEIIHLSYTVASCWSFYKNYKNYYTQLPLKPRNLVNKANLVHNLFLVYLFLVYLLRLINIRRINCAPTWLCLQDYTGTHCQQNVKKNFPKILFFTSDIKVASQLYVQTWDRLRDIESRAWLRTAFFRTRCQTARETGIKPVKTSTGTRFLFGYLYFRTVHLVIFILFKPTHALFLKHIHIHI